MSPKAEETKAKMNFWDFIKIKSLCTAKETVNETKRQPMEQEKIFANDTIDKGLISKIYKELLKLNTHKTENHIKKWAEDMNRHFSNEIMNKAKRQSIDREEILANDISDIGLVPKIYLYNRTYTTQHPKNR